MITYLDIVENFFEGESHSTSNYHLIDFVDEVLNQLNLVLNLGATQNRDERTCRVLQSL